MTNVSTVFYIECIDNYVLGEGQTAKDCRQSEHQADCQRHASCRWQGAITGPLWTVVTPCQNITG